MGRRTRWCHMRDADVGLALGGTPENRLSLAKRVAALAPESARPCPTWPRESPSFTLGANLRPYSSHSALPKEICLCLPCLAPSPPAMRRVHWFHRVACCGTEYFQLSSMPSRSGKFPIRAIPFLHHIAGNNGVMQLSVRSWLTHMHPHGRT